jgi:hypothetical protein
MEPIGVAGLITIITGEVIPSDVLEDEEQAGSYMMAVLRKFSNENATKMIGALTTVIEEK